jgi:CreA protein
MSYAQTGGISGAFGLAENPSRFSIACRQVGPLISHKNIAVKTEGIFTQKMSPLLKGLKVTRMFDRDNNSLVYLVISEKLIDGSPYNSISTVPLMPWGTITPKVQ